MSKSASSAHRVPPYKRPIIIVGFLLILAAVVIATIFIFKSIGVHHDPNDSTHISNPNQDSDNVSKPSGDQPSSLEEQPEDKTPQYEGENPNELDELTGVIIYKDIDPENQILHSAISIDQYLQSDGQCVFNLKRDDVIIRTTSAIATQDVTTSVCGPIDISTEGLEGTYQIEILLSGDNKRGEILDEITI